MGCVSSSLLEGDGAEDDRRRIISHHHIVSLTSSTYGVLTSPRAYCSSSSTAKPVALGPEAFAPPPAAATHCVPPPPPPPPLPRPPTTTRQQAPPAPKPESQPQAEVINSWELMAGLVDPSTPAKLDGGRDHQRRRRIPLRAIDGNSSASKASLPPSSVVLYTTSLRGVRATFEACNAVRAALQAHGVAFRERDVSMDRGFRDELRSKLGLLGGARAPAAMLPRLFVRGRHVGGAEDVLRLDEEGLLAPLLEGLPRARGGGGAYCCDGCGGMRFLPCFDCSGSRKLAVTLPAVATSAAATASCRRRKKAGTVVVVRCGECNENGLVLCPICS